MKRSVIIRGDKTHNEKECSRALLVLEHLRAQDYDMASVSDKESSAKNSKTQV